MSYRTHVCIYVSDFDEEFVEKLIRSCGENFEYKDECQNAIAFHFEDTNPHALSFIKKMTEQGVLFDMDYDTEGGGNYEYAVRFISPTEQKTFTTNTETRNNVDIDDVERHLKSGTLEQFLKDEKAKYPVEHYLAVEQFRVLVDSDVVSHVNKIDVLTSSQTQSLQAFLTAAIRLGKSATDYLEIKHESIKTFLLKGF